MATDNIHVLDALPVRERDGDKRSHFPLSCLVISLPSWQRSTPHIGLKEWTAAMKFIDHLKDVRRAPSIY